MIKVDEAYKYHCPAKICLENGKYKRQGDDCAAWRWADVVNPDYIQPHIMAYPPRLPWENPMTIKSNTHGYCGLAGRS